MANPQDKKPQPKPKAAPVKETEWPSAGGSYTRDPATGRLKPNPEADRANPAETDDGT